MKKYNFADCLIIGGDNNAFEVRLAHSNDINEVVYNTDGDICEYDPDYNDMQPCGEDKFYEGDFEDRLLYIEDEDGDFDYIEDPDYPEDAVKYSRCDWSMFEHYRELESEHGINQEYYDITDAEVIEGTCYKADNYIPQDYPHQEYTSFFKFVADDGRVFFLKKESPFYSDQSDDTYEFIDEEEFNDYD